MRLKSIISLPIKRTQLSGIRQKKHQRRLPIMENYNFESEIEETSKLMREWYESLIPETLRKLDQQLTKLPKGQIGLIFFKDGNIKASLTTPKYDPDIVNRLKNVHYFYGKKPAWNPQKKRWEIEIDFLSKIIFAFPDFELSPSLLSRFPSTKEIQENGTRAILYIHSTIQKYASEDLIRHYVELEEMGIIKNYVENPEENYWYASRIILGKAPCNAEVQPKIKELAWKMGFSESNWEKPE